MFKINKCNNLLNITKTFTYLLCLYPYYLLAMPCSLHAMPKATPTCCANKSLMRTLR